MATLDKPIQRLTYISNFARPLSDAEIDHIEQKSIENNRRDNLTGVLFCFNNIFYQILEGEEEALKICYNRILKDPRHKDIFCLGIENDIHDRNYGEWNMKAIKLDETQDSVIRPMRGMLNALALTHRLLEKYTPQKVLTAMQAGENPTEIKSILTEKVIMFSDIMGSTTIAENLPVEYITDILDKYYEICNSNILKRSGIVSKLTGDGVMAYFEAHEADVALEVGLNIARDLEWLRKKAPDQSHLKLLYAGLGYSAGKVVEGNIGSAEKKDFTLIGDAVNTAARIESVTRKVNYSLVFDGNVRALLGQNTQVKQLGKYRAKGKEQITHLYTLPDPVLASMARKNDILTSVQEFAARLKSTGRRGI